jgi:bacillolysin
MRYRSMLAATAVTALAAATTVVTTTTSSAVDTTPVTATQSAQPAGSFALSGKAAAHYKLPSDMRELHTTTFPDGRTQTRYQQLVGGASVFGGQITIIRSTRSSAAPPARPRPSSAPTSRPCRPRTRHG